VWVLQAVSESVALIFQEEAGKPLSLLSRAHYSLKLGHLAWAVFLRLDLRREARRVSWKAKMIS